MKNHKAIIALSADCLLSAGCSAIPYRIISIKQHAMPKATKALIAARQAESDLAARSIVWEPTHANP